MPSASFLAITFTRPSVSPMIWARLLARYWCLATTMSKPAAGADSSEWPAHATSGKQ